MLSTRIVGDIDDSGIFCGRMKFAGDGGRPYALERPGIEKSSIESLRMIPVDVDRILLPNLGMEERIKLDCLIDMRLNK